MGQKITAKWLTVELAMQPFVLLAANSNTFT